MNISDKVTAYLEKTLSSEEAAAFESSLETNPELKRELDFQNEVIDAIREARVLELKTMLNNVPIGGGVGASGNLFQYVSAAIVTLLIGFGLYYFWPAGESSVDPTYELTSPLLSEEENQKDAGIITEEISQPEIIQEPVIEKEKKDPVQISPVQTNKVNPVPVDSINPTENTITEDNTDPINLKDARPAILDDFETEESTTSEIPENKLFDKSAFYDGPIEVEINNSEKKYNFHYQFVNGRLMLYGDFSEAYEILDFMQEEQRSIYLYYQQKYYPLLKTQTNVIELVPIKQAALIKNLEERRKSRN